MRLRETALQRLGEIPGSVVSREDDAHLELGIVLTPAAGVGRQWLASREARPGQAVPPDALAQLGSPDRIERHESRRGPPHEDLPSAAAPSVVTAAAAAARSGARCCRASSQRSALILPVLAPAVTCTWVPSAGGRPREFVSRTVSTSGPSATGASRRSCFCSNAGRSGPKTQTLTIAAPGPCRRSSRGDSPAGTTPGRHGGPSGAA